MASPIRSNAHDVTINLVPVSRNHESKVCKALFKPLIVAKQLFDQFCPVGSVKRSIAVKVVPIAAISLLACLAAEGIIESITPPCTDPCQGQQAYEYKKNRSESRLIVFMGSAVLTEVMVTCFFFTILARACCGYAKDKYKSWRIQEIKNTHLD